DLRTYLRICEPAGRGSTSHPVSGPPLIRVPAVEAGQRNAHARPPLSRSLRRRVAGPLRLRTERRRGSAGDEQLLHPVVGAGGVHGYLVCRYGQPEVGEALEEPGQDGLQFGTGDVLAQALMDAVAEGQVAGHLPLEVRDIGIGEDAWIAVGRVHRHDDEVALADL